MEKGKKKEKKENKDKPPVDILPLLHTLLFGTTHDIRHQALVTMRNAISNNSFPYQQYTQCLRTEIRHMARLLPDSTLYGLLVQLVSLQFQCKFGGFLMKNTLTCIQSEVPTRPDSTCTLLSLFKDVPAIMEYLQENNNCNMLMDYMLLFDQYDFSVQFPMEELINKVMSASKTNKQLIKVLQLPFYCAYQEYIFSNYNSAYHASFLADIMVGLGLSKQDHPYVQNTLIENACRYYIRTYEWQRVEQKLMGDPDVLALAMDIMCKKQQDMNVVYSIVTRQQLIEKGEVLSFNLRKKMKQNGYIYLRNDLFTRDAFCPTEMFFDPAQQNNGGRSWLTLQEYGIQEQDVWYIDQVECQAFQQAAQDLLGSDGVGIDSEFTNTYTKLDPPGRIATLQLATSTRVYVFDMMALSQQSAFVGLVSDLFSSKSVVKLGHSLSADVAQLNQSMHFPQGLAFNNYIDLAQVFRETRQGTKYSLQYMVETLLDKAFSKFEQCSNWTQRPLRKSQLHYAALDAYVCLVIYRVFSQELSLQPYVQFSIAQSTPTTQPQPTQKAPPQHTTIQDMYQRIMQASGMKEKPLRIHGHLPKDKVTLVFQPDMDRLRFYTQQLADQLGGVAFQIKSGPYEGGVGEVGIGYEEGKEGETWCVVGVKSDLVIQLVEVGRLLRECGQ